MRRIILVLIVIAVIAMVGAYFVHGYLESKAREKAKQERVAKLRESTRDAITKMVSKFGAIDDWEKKLSEGRTGKSSEERILTMDLEKLWLSDKPILFKGHIKDISTLDRDTYSMWVDQQIDKFSFETKLALSLECQKTLIDSFLSVYPAARKDFANIAVIAKINKIESKSRLTETDEEVTRIGIGQCLDIVYRDERALEHDEL